MYVAQHVCVCVCCVLLVTVEGCLVSDVIDESDAVRAAIVV